MRHRKAGRKLKRTASHRRATLAALSTALLRNKRITTTIAKAKETRPVVERLITKAKRAISPSGGGGADGASRAAKFVQAGGHARREVGRFIKDRAVVAELFTTIAPKVASRPGGYTRIMRLGQRHGDGAELAVIELVDFSIGQESAEKAPPKEKKVAQQKKSASRPKGAASQPAPSSEPQEAAPGKKARTTKKKAKGSA